MIPEKIRSDTLCKCGYPSLHDILAILLVALVSPVLANIYLHYVLDLWFERVVKPGCEGQAHIIRFADDFVWHLPVQEGRQKILSGVA